MIQAPQTPDPALQDQEDERLTPTPGEAGDNETGSGSPRPYAAVAQLEEHLANPRRFCINLLACRAEALSLLKPDGWRFESSQLHDFRCCHPMAPVYRRGRVNTQYTGYIAQFATSGIIEADSLSDGSREA